jgi:hypothetical protein
MLLQIYKWAQQGSGAGTIEGRKPGGRGLTGNSAHSDKLWECGCRAPQRWVRHDLIQLPGQLQAGRQGGKKEKGR